MVKDKMEADDITQETIIRIWQNIDKFNILAAKSWIIKTTHNLCLDFLRKKKSLKFSYASLDEEIHEFLPDYSTAADPVLTTDFRMLGEDLKTAIKSLPETYRSIFVLFHINGLKYREISKVLNIPVNSVKVYLMRARKKLQEELKNYELRN